MKRSCLVAAAAIFAATAGRADEPLTVDLITAHFTAGQITYAITGEIQAHDSLTIGAKGGGRLLAMHVDVGDRVTAGQILAELDPTQATEAVRAAEAQLVATEAALKQADQAHARASELLTQGASTRAAVDAATEALDGARSQRDQMLAALSKARQALDDVVIRADGPAIVTARNAEPGQVIGAAESILTLARDSGLEAVFHAPDGFDLTVLLGRRITLHTLDAPVIEAGAIIAEIAPVADPASGTVKVTARLEANGPQPGLGAAVTSAISIGQPPGFSVPWSALAVLDGQPALWVADPASKAVQLKPVTVARYTDQTIEISGGLTEGDLVVGTGSNFLYPGRLVQVAEGQ